MWQPSTEHRTEELRESLVKEENVIAVLGRTLKTFDGVRAEKKFSFEVKPVLKQCILLSSHIFLAIALVESLVCSSNPER